MGKTVSCEECSETYRTLEHLEDLRDNDGICLVCNAPIEVADWDRVLASHSDDDLDDVDDIEDLDPPLGDDDWDPLSGENDDDGDGDGDGDAPLDGDDDDDDDFAKEEE